MARVVTCAVFYFVRDSENNGSQNKNFMVLFAYIFGEKITLVIQFRNAKVPF